MTLNFQFDKSSAFLVCGYRGAHICHIMVSGSVLWEWWAAFSLPRPFFFLVEDLISIGELSNITFMLVRMFYLLLKAGGISFTYSLLVSFWICAQQSPESVFMITHRYLFKLLKSEKICGTSNWPNIWYFAMSLGGSVRKMLFLKS